MEFKTFAKAINTQFNTMTQQDLFVVDITREQLWDAYQASFPDGTNEIYKERPHHDCNTCKQFIRNIGAVVAIKDGQYVTVWDVESDSFYKEVADKMAELIRTAAILAPFKRSEKKYGVLSNIQLLEDGGTITWNHFHCEIPSQFLSDTPSSDISKVVSTVGVFRRGLEELTTDALGTVANLIADNLLYKGDEFARAVQNFRNTQEYYIKAADKDTFIWSNCKLPHARFKNTVIGSLVEDLSKGVDLESAVKSFESKTAPENYKRSSALITQGMIDNATATINELGIESSLHRRLAVATDVSVNNVIYADVDTATHMQDSIADLLAPAVKPKKVNDKNTTEITIDEFISTVIPKTSLLEMQLANSHQNNLMTLVSPQDPESAPIFKWDNNFSWSYNGNITDSSMKDKVKAAGGNVEGFLRFSIQWNEEGTDGSNDLDAHCICPEGHIMYNNMMRRLDVDIMAPGQKTAVENITWPAKADIRDGQYTFFVHNFSGRNTNGFRAEVEIDGVIHSFDYPKSVTSDVPVAVVTVKNGEFTIDCKLDSAQSSKEVYGIPTQDFHKVQMVMHSPNHWDEQEIGNKHTFFILEGCTVDEPVNGFYNEFLSGGLTEHRKVFEILSSKTRCQPEEQSLSGLGFSSTVRNEVLVKADGRPYKLMF